MRRSPCLAVGVLACLLVPLVAQPGPGIPSLVYPQSDVFSIISNVGQGSHGHSMMLDGYLVTARTGFGLRFYDISNPYAPALVQTIASTTGMDLSEPHTMAQTTAWGGLHVLLMRGSSGLGGKGFALWDLADVFNPALTTSFDLPGVPGGYASGVFWIFLQAPYIYCPVGSLGLIIVDAGNPANPVVVNQVPKSQLGGFNAVLAFAVGNTLILANSDSGTGFARLDISDPVNPVLLASTTQTPIPYGAQVNGEAILIPAVSGCASCPGGGAGSFRVSKLSAPSLAVNEIALPSRGASAVYQDGFVHIAASAAYVKVDIRDDNNYPVVGTTLNTNPGGDFDWVTPIGNLVTMGDDQGGATQLIPHQALPDNTGPAVTMVDPPDGAGNQALTSRVGITLSDMVETSTISNATFFVRPLGGPKLTGKYSNQFGIVNFWPDQPLLPNTTYEVIVPTGGLQDWAGNTTATQFRSVFSTGSQVNNLGLTVQRLAPATLGTLLTFNVASVSGTGPFQYSWDFGDGTPATPFSGNSQTTHAYTEAGHYSVLCVVQSGAASVTDSYIQTIHHPLPANRPTRSSTIILEDTHQRVWCVNPDNDTVTAIDAQTRQKVLEASVGDHPRTLARAPDGAIWVVCQDAATIHVLDPASGANLTTIALRAASAPYGLAMSPDGTLAYVSLQATGEVTRLDPIARRVVDRTAVGPKPRGIAISSDSQRVFVTRFISRHGGEGQVYELLAASDALIPQRTIPLAVDPGPDTDASGRGIPNYLGSPAISPDGRRLWIPSKKDNILRGQFRDGQVLTFENTVRTISSQIDLSTGREDRGARIDFNNRDLAFAVEFSTYGDYAFHVLQGSNALDVRDAWSGDLVATVEGTGLAPQGLVLVGNDTLFVHNFMSRTVTIHDVGGVTSSTSFAIPLLANVSTVANEALTPQVLQGKQIFYNAADPRMNQDGYISCASCHLDGGQDGRVWDFTDRGEGLRNTISLTGRSGMGHGNVHWTANFDEIQDFENDIRGGFGGDGFMSDQLFFSGTVSVPLGQPKAGLSPELDALAAYVASLSSFGVSPFRMPGGGLSPSAQRGRSLFKRLSCAQCHSGQGFTDSPAGLLHDVGTITAASGQAIGGQLTGFDTPTLRGLWSTAPYLHDGSAATLLDVLATRNRAGLHGATLELRPRELQDLVTYLLSIDDLEPAAGQ